MAGHILKVIVDGVEDVCSVIATSPVVWGATGQMMQVIPRERVVILCADEQESPVVLAVAGRGPVCPTIELGVRDGDVACSFPARYDHLTTDKAELAVVDPDLVCLLDSERIATPDVLRVDVVEVDVLDYDVGGSVNAQPATLDDALVADANYGLVAVDSEWLTTSRIVCNRRDGRRSAASARQRADVVLATVEDVAALVAAGRGGGAHAGRKVEGFVDQNDPRNIVF